jgi:hypothetical protein
MPNENNYPDEIVASLNVINSALTGLNEKIELQNERILKLEGNQAQAIDTVPVYTSPPIAPAPVPLSATNSLEIKFFQPNMQSASVHEAMKI